MKKENFSAYVVPVSQIRKTDAEWVIPHWIPKGGITLLAGDGGVGKTSLWVKLFAELSSGQQTILEEPEPLIREKPDPKEEAELIALSEEERQTPDRFLPNKTCMYFSAEDSSSKRLRSMLEKYGATTEKIITIDLDHLSGLSYSSPELEKIIRENRPEICVFDPIQAFMPHGASMSSRQQIREALDNLVRFGAVYGTAFLLVCHTNKKKTDDWRQRLSGSADLADIARSVIFTDYTQLAPNKQIRFISNEKNSYYAPEKTVLYRFEDGLLTFAGVSAKRFAEYALDDPYGQVVVTRKTQKEICKEEIRKFLKDKDHVPVKELDEALAAAGMGKKAVTTAKMEMEADGQIVRWSEYDGSRPCWFVKLEEAYDPAGEEEEVSISHVWLSK